MIDELISEVEQVVPEPVVQEQETPQPEQQPQETPQQRNFKALKQAKEQAERERDDLMQRLIQQEQIAHHPVQNEPSLNPDDLVEARYVDNKLKKIEEQLAAYQQQTTAIAIEARLKAQYADFDHVVTKDNLDILRVTHPELHATLTHSPDLYNKAVSAYTLIKQLNISSHDEYEQDRQLAHKNATKPKPTASISGRHGASPLSSVNGFVEDYKPSKEYLEQLYKEMKESAKKF